MSVDNLHVRSDACAGLYPATWACFDERSLHHRRNTVIHDYADSPSLKGSNIIQKPPQCDGLIRKVHNIPFALSNPITRVPAPQEPVATVGRQALAIANDWAI